MIREERIKQEAKKYRKYRELCGVIDPVALDEIEDAHYDGYMCAEKAMIEKACEWLEENLPIYWSQVNANDTEEFIDKFKKAMEE